jgi:hypothetical protein
MAARELGLGSRGPDPKGPWAALDALGEQPLVPFELSEESAMSMTETTHNGAS